MKAFFKKEWWNKVLTMLRVREVVGALEVTDMVLRYSELTGADDRAFSLRLSPGIIVDGKLKDEVRFREALRLLRERLGFGKGRRSVVNIVLSVSSSDVYAQVFALPLMKGEDLERAVALNMQMASPTELGAAYTGWQMVSAPGASQLEILALFVSHERIDGILNTLDSSGFLVHAVEPRSLSRVRLLRELGSGFDARAAYITIALDNVGIEFLVIRHGALYFQYCEVWKDLYGTRREVSIEDLKTAIVKNLRSVLNFYNTHWSDLVLGVFVFGGEMQERVKKIISENFSLKVLDVRLTTIEPVQYVWYVALGAALRGKIPRGSDHEASLLGISAQDEFRREQAVRFFRFWSILMPVALALLLVVLAGTDVALRQMRRAIEDKAHVALDTAQAGETTALAVRVRAFNQTIDLITRVDRSFTPKGALLDEIIGLLSQFGLTANKLSMQGAELSTSLTGHAPSEDRILQFKKALESDPRFHGVNLPFSEIKPDGSGKSFLINFSVKVPAKS